MVFQLRFLGANRCRAISGLALIFAAVLLLPAYATALPRAAAIELEAPNSEVFPLRAVIPIPKGKYIPAGATPGELIPFALETSNGQIYDAQVSPVSFYPNRAEDGARTVELVVSRFRRPPGILAGERFTVFAVPRRHVRGRLNTTPEVMQFLNSSDGEVYLTARDVFGNEYRADLMEELGRGNGELLENGAERMRIAVRTVMRPVQYVAGAAGTLPRLFGVNIFLTFYRDSVFEVALQIHNGFVDRDPGTELDNALHEIHFSDLRLKLPARWSIAHPFQNPNLGAVSGSAGEFYLIRPLPDGKMQYFRLFGQTVFRFAAYLDGSSRLHDLASDIIQYRTLGFSTASIGVPWNYESLGFGPAQTKLPSFRHLDIESERHSISTSYRAYKTRIANGISGGELYFPRLGWAHPWGIQYGGETGGGGIQPVPGTDVLIARTAESLLLELLRSTQSSQRHPAVFVNGQGNPVKPEDYLVQTSAGPSVPFYFNDWRVTSTGHNPFHVPTSNFQNSYTESHGLVAPYRAMLDGFQTFDTQHLTRYSSPLITLALLANDPLAKEQLRQTSYAYALAFHDYLDISISTNLTEWGLLSALAFTGIVPMPQMPAHPHFGVHFGRATAWGVMSQIAYATMGSQRDFDYFYPRFQKVALALIDGQNPHGLIMRRSIIEYFNGQFKILQVFEETFLGFLAMSLRNSVFDGSDRLLQGGMCHVLAGQARGVLTYPWDPVAARPRMVVGVAANSVSAPPFETLPTNAYNPNNYDVNIYFPSLVAMGFECASGPEAQQNRQFLLQRMHEAFGPNLKQIFEGFGREWLAMRAPALRLAQDLGGSL